MAPFASNARRRGLDDRALSSACRGRKPPPSALQPCQAVVSVSKDGYATAGVRPDRDKAILPGTRPARETSHQTLTPCTLLFVFGIPAGYLPLLAAVESSPVEVGVTLFLLTAFGCLEALPLDPRIRMNRADRTRHGRTAKVCCVYAYCLVLGMVVGGATGDSGGSFTPFQNWLSSTVPVHPGLLEVARHAAVRGSGLGDSSVGSPPCCRCRGIRAALWAAFLATPFLSPWHLLIMMFRARLGGWPLP